MGGRPGRFFIAGCQRTGTTLARLVLESHPRVACLDEVESYRALVEDRPIDRPGATLVGYKIPRWTEQLSDAVVGDFGQDEAGPQFYRGEPIVFLLRDVRDAVAAMLELKVDGRTWLEAWALPILRAKARDAAFRERYGRELKLLRAAGDPLPGVGALYWKYKTAAFFDELKRGRPVLGLRFERLVAEPEPTLRRVLEFLGLPWHPAVLDHPSAPHGEVFGDGTTVGGTDPARPIDGGAAGAWRRDLSADDARQVLDVAGDLHLKVVYHDRAPGGLAA